MSGGGGAVIVLLVIWGFFLIFLYNNFSSGANLEVTLVNDPLFGSIISFLKWLW